MADPPGVMPGRALSSAQADVQAAASREAM
jgi:hypothetical protein